VSFRSIVGHRRLISLLSRAVAVDTLPPSLLLAGPAGIGKRRTAIAIAKAINCLRPVVQPRSLDGEEPLVERDACGECASCRRIDRGVHPDVLIIEPGETGSIKIEQVRSAIDRAGYRPFEARRRVVIVDEADAMQAPAQSALLKTLEEPPSASIFLLVSSLPDSLLPTVRSRCPRLRFGALSAQEVALVLMRDHGYAEPEARAAAAEADGTIGGALAAGSSDVEEARAAAQRILEQTARTGDPVRRLDAVRDLMGAKGTPAAERNRLSVCLRALASLLRDIGMLSEGADAKALANPDVRPKLDALARAFDGRRSAAAYSAVDQALSALERNASPKVVADWLVMQI
jgi:DNA polymerase III subunit delta'